MDLGSNILRRRAVMAATGLPQSTLYAEMAAGRFPRPIKISGDGPNARACGWLESEINAWKAARIKERDSKNPSTEG